MKSSARSFLFALVALSIVALAVRLVAAGTLGFGDSEALYASYALHPQPAYLDHPGLIGVLARALGGGSSPTPAAAHVFTAIVATLVPWVLLLAARLTGGSWRGSLAAALGVALVPEVAIGLFAMTPDLLLFCGWVGALGAAAAALRSKPSSTRAVSFFLLSGVLVGASSTAKLSALTLLVALTATYASKVARDHGRTAWPWLSLLVSMVPLLPVARYEERLGWPMLQHRLIETQSEAGLSLRNAGALVGGQALYLSPLFAIAAFLLARDLWQRRREDSTAVLLASATFIPLAFLSALCLWSRVAEPHWIAPALLALPLHYARSPASSSALAGTRLSDRFWSACLRSALGITGVVHVLVMTPIAAWAMRGAYDPRLDISNELYGWSNVVAGVERIAADEKMPGAEDIEVVGPHWVICAQLHAALRDRLPVGCAEARRDDFDDWNPRARWETADTLLFVSDNRYSPDLGELFPLHAMIRQTQIPIVRGGRITRLFTVSVLERRAPA